MTDPRPAPPARTGRTLVVRLDSLGDLVLAGPAIRAVARDAEVTLLCGRRGTPLAPLLPGVARAIEFRAPWIADDRPGLDADATAALVDRLRTDRYDEAVILTSSRQSSLPTALLLKMAGVPRVVGLTVDSPGALLDDAIRNDLEVHEVERALAIVALAGHVPAPGDTALQVRVDPMTPALATAIPDRYVREGYVVVHPGASVAARTLDPVVWRAVTELLVATGSKVVVTGAAGETAALADLPVVDLGGRTELPELVSVLAGADTVCVGNTGAMHLAAAVGTPICAVFPPTVPLRRWRPWQVPHVVLGDQDVGCSGCHARTCPRPSAVCLAGVTPAEVVGAVETLRAGAPAGGAGVEVPA